MKNSHIIIESSLTWVLLLYQQKKSIYKKIKSQKIGHLNVIQKWYSIFFFVQMILNFQKKINVIMYIIEFSNY
jgi:hypothetical protein